MEIITIDSLAFKELTGQIREIAAYVRKYGTAIREENDTGKEYLTSAEVCEMLHISSRTLQRMRDAKVIGFTLRRQCVPFQTVRYREVPQGKRNNIKNGEIWIHLTEQHLRMV